MKSWIMGASLWLLLAAHAVGDPAPEVVFGRIPAVIDAEISPDGQHVAILGGAATQRIVSIATVDKPGMPWLALGDLIGVGLVWADNEHVLAPVRVWKRLAPREAYEFERTLSVDLQARTVASLLEHDQASVYMLRQSILQITKSPPRALVLGLRLTDRAELDTFSIDPANGKGQLVQSARGDGFYFGADAKGDLRVQAYFLGQERRYAVVYRPSLQAPWTRVWEGEYGASGFYDYAAGENAIYVIENDRFVRLKLDTGAKEIVGPNLEHASPWTIWDAPNNRLAGLETGAEKLVANWLDPELGAVHASLEKAFPGKEVDFANWSEDRKRFVVRVGAADVPATWYLFDRTRRELSPLGEEYPELKGRAPASTRWIAYKARDGLDMGAYLTLPPGASSIARLPLVVLPHDWTNAGRDLPDFDYLSQYIAARGYAVLRPQYRGSRIFGQSFVEAGFGEWAGKIQTDLLDGVAAAAATGTVDPNRTCIVGLGFGGYEALAGAAFHSESYRCAAAINAFSSLGLLMSEGYRRGGTDSPYMLAFRRAIGELDRAHLDAASPSKHAASIAVPVLLMHGDEDPFASMTHATLMADSLNAAGKPYELIVLHGENHYMDHAQTRTEMLTRLGDFLAKNLPTNP
jgi:dipeptidyl aminopeptidase/acylaminoacyl peptidase